MCVASDECTVMCVYIDVCVSSDVMYVVMLCMYLVMLCMYIHVQGSIYWSYLCIM